jgi:excisionase family DNA binding protein
VNKDDPELLKIADAARILDVSRRTIYRRIWNGDLPASKVGGLYYIRQEDLEGLLIRGRTKSPRKEAKKQSALKCSACFRVLESDAQIAELCTTGSCDSVICDHCWSDSVRHCVKHLPDRDEKWKSAWAAHQRGELPLLVKGSKARLQEMNFLKHITERIYLINTLIHPVTEDVLTVSDWNAYCQSGDERAELMKLLGVMVLDTATTTNIPLNAWIHWDIPKGKRLDGLPLRICAQVLSRTHAMLRDGFDTRPLGEKELSEQLAQLNQKTKDDKMFTLVVLAATVGWDAEAQQAVQGDRHGKAVVYEDMLVYLFDLQSKKLIYNLHDHHAWGYIDLFAPVLPEQEIQEVIAGIKREFLIHDSLSLQIADQTLPYSANVLRGAFERMAATGGYTLTVVPEIGTVIVQN